MIPKTAAKILASAKHPLPNKKTKPQNYDPSPFSGIEGSSDAATLAQEEASSGEESMSAILNITLSMYIHKDIP